MREYPQAQINFQFEHFYLIQANIHIDSKI